MVEQFLAWAASLIRSQQAGIVDATVTVSAPSGNPSARLDFDTQTIVARITVWESGNFQAEAIDVATEQVVFEQSGVSSKESSQSAALFDEIVRSVMRTRG